MKSGRVTHLPGKFWQGNVLAGEWKEDFAALFLCQTFPCHWLCLYSILALIAARRAVALRVRLLAVTARLACVRSAKHFLHHGHGGFFQAQEIGLRGAEDLQLLRGKEGGGLLQHLLIALLLLLQHAVHESRPPYRSAFPQPKVTPKLPKPAATSFVGLNSCLLCFVSLWLAVRLNCMNDNDQFRALKSPGLLKQPP